MQVIYEARGKAREYNELALSVYRGCSNRCRYCFGPEVTHTTREAYSLVSPRKNILAKIDSDCRAMVAAGDGRHVFMSFVTDPYPEVEPHIHFTRQAIEILHRYSIPVMLLTKGGARACNDFDLLSPIDKFGVTLTFLDDKRSLEWEPRAALPSERLDTLRMAHQQGITTWVSLEPVIDPVATLDIIREGHEFVNFWKLGPLDAKGDPAIHKVVQSTDWHKFAHDAMDLLEELGATYFFKHALQVWL